MDASALAALLPSAQRRTDPLPALALHLQTHGGYVSWSGGKDSTTAVDLVRQVDPGTPICFFDSGLEFPETLTYIDQMADRWSLNLHVIPAVPDALSILTMSGAWHHDRPTNHDAPRLHDALITEPAARAARRFGTGTVWGLRAGESQARRMLLSRNQGTFTRADGVTVHSPVWNWRDIDITAHLARRDIPLNPVYAKLAALGAQPRDLRVGLMLDANGLSNGRAAFLRRGWPEQWARMAAALPRLTEWR